MARKVESYLRHFISFTRVLDVMQIHLVRYGGGCLVILYESCTLSLSLSLHILLKWTTKPQDSMRISSYQLRWSRRKVVVDLSFLPLLVCGLLAGWMDHGRW